MTDSISRPIDPQKAEVADAAYEHLLEVVDKVNPALTNILRKKYEDDRQEFIQAARDAMPSTDPAYWAKRGCSKCYGRGIIGKKHTFLPRESASSEQQADGKKTYVNSTTTLDIQCRCTRKNFEKWMSEFRLFFNMLKAQTIAAAAEKTGETEDA